MDPVVLDDLAGGTAERDKGVFEVVLGGSLGGPDVLCRELKGAFFTPSDTDARGRATEEAEPVGEATEARPASPAGLALAEADKDGFESGGAVAFVGTIDALRFGVGAGPGAVRVAGVAGFEAIVGVELMDFFRAGAPWAGAVFTGAV